jgi:hypothetical protein
MSRMGPWGDPSGSHALNRIENSGAYRVPPRREPMPYPNYYDGRPFNPRAGNNFDDDLVRQLLLEWTPVGDEVDSTAKGDEPGDRANGKSTTESSSAGPGTQTEGQEQEDATIDKFQTRDENDVNGLEENTDGIGK